MREGLCILDCGVESRYAKAARAARSEQQHIQNIREIRFDISATITRAAKRVKGKIGSRRILARFAANALLGKDHPFSERRLIDLRADVM